MPFNMKRIILLIFSACLMACSNNKVNGQTDSKVKKTSATSHVKLKYDGVKIDPKAIGLFRRAQAIVDSGQMYTCGAEPDSVRLAISLCQKALKLDSNYKFAFMFLAIYQSSLREYKEALETLDQAGKRFDDEPQIPAFKGFIYDIQGDSVQASMAYQKAKKLDESILHRGKDLYAYIDMAFFVGLIEGESEYMRILREGSISGNFTYKEKESLRRMIDFGPIDRYQIARKSVSSNICVNLDRKKNQRKIIIYSK